MLFDRINAVGVFVLQISERTHRHRIQVVIISCVRLSCPYARLQLVFVVYRRILKRSVDFVSAVIEHRSLRPIAVEAHKRKRQIALFGISAGQSHKPLDEHTVNETFVDIIFFLLRKFEGNVYGRLRACGYRQNVAVFRRAFPDYAPNGNVVRQHMRLLGNGKSVAGKLFCHKYRVEFETVFVCRACVLYLKRNVVLADLIVVVAEVYVRSVIYRLVFGKQIHLRFKRICQTTQACALFTRRIRQTVPVVNDSRGAHNQLINALVQFNRVVL